MNIIRVIFVAVLASLGTDSFAVEPAGMGDTKEAGESAMREYVFVLIRTGPLADPTPEQMQKAMDGHFANMGKLAEAGKLLISGPLVEPKAEPDHRGLWIFKGGDLEAALELGKSDPAVEMGVFRLEAGVFRSADPLGSLIRLEKEDEARRLADPDVPDAWEGRSYIVAGSAVGVIPDYQRGSGVLIEGILEGGASNTISGETSLRLVFLDAEKVDQAKTLLGDQSLGWTFTGWYSSKMIAKLPDAAEED